jgi:hypothetical protein
VRDGPHATMNIINSRASSTGAAPLTGRN